MPPTLAQLPLLKQADRKPNPRESQNNYDGLQDLSAPSFAPPMLAHLVSLQVMLVRISLGCWKKRWSQFGWCSTIIGRFLLALIYFYGSGIIP